MKYNPSRIIPKNYRNITGKFASKKASRLISYESKLERDFLYLFELDNQVINMFEQPITIQYIKNNKTHRYTPDLYIVTPPNQNDIVAEMKYNDDLKLELINNKDKFRALIEYTKNKNIDFKFFTDKCLKIKSDAYKFNTHFLINYNELSSADY